MMDSFTRYCKNLRHSGFLRGCLFLILVGLGPLICAQAQTQTQAQTICEVSQLRVERAEDAIQLSAQIQFELPQAVEEALLKGIPLVFVMDAQILRERWYWYDKRLAGAQRQLRLVFQPLARRWRLNVSAGTGAVGLTLNQSYDTLAQALAAIKRVSKWKIADVSELDSGPKARVEFQFRLDLGQLPRPFLIGAVGPSEWDISATAQTPLNIETGR